MTSETIEAPEGPFIKGEGLTEWTDEDMDAFYEMLHKYGTRFLERHITEADLWHGHPCHVCNPNDDAEEGNDCPTCHGERHVGYQAFFPEDDISSPAVQLPADYSGDPLAPITN